MYVLRVCKFHGLVKVIIYLISRRKCVQRIIGREEGRVCVEIKARKIIGGRRRGTGLFCEIVKLSEILK